MSDHEGATRYIYVLRNDEHRLVYVGQTKQPEVRAKQHRRHAADGASYLYRTMRKVGIDSFRFEVLHSVEDVAEATQAEQLWIDWHRTEGDWCVLNDAVASPPKSRGKFKALVLNHLASVIANTPIGSPLPTLAETTAATQACSKSVQRCYEELARLGRIKSAGPGRRYRRVA